MNSTNSILDAFEPNESIIDELEELEQVEDVEERLKLEAQKILKAKQKSQMDDMRDTGYYAVIVFGNRHDKNTFLSQIKDTEVESETFVDGYQFAKNFGLDVPMTVTLPKPHYVKQVKIKGNGNKIRKT